MGKNRHVRNILEAYGEFDISKEVDDYLFKNRCRKEDDREKVFDNCPYAHMLYAEYESHVANRLAYDDSKYYNMKHDKTMIKIKLIALTKSKMRYMIYDYHHHEDAFLTRTFDQLGGIPIVRGNEIVYVLTDDDLKDWYEGDVKMMVVESDVDGNIYEYLENYCINNDYEIAYSDSIAIDYGQHPVMVYTDASNTIVTNGELLGRKGFEDGFVAFEDISEEFVDNYDRALPSWFLETDIHKNGFVKIDEEFDAGMYTHNRNDVPKDIYEKIKSKSSDEVLFKISYVSPFDMGFNCYIKKEDEDEF